MDFEREIMILFVAEDPVLVSRWEDVRGLTEALNAHGPIPFLTTGEVDAMDLVRWESQLAELMDGLVTTVEDLRAYSVNKVKDAPVVAMTGSLDD